MEFNKAVGQKKDVLKMCSECIIESNMFVLIFNIRQKWTLYRYVDMVIVFKQKNIHGN